MYTSISLLFSIFFKNILILYAMFFIIRMFVKTREEYLLCLHFLIVCPAVFLAGLIDAIGGGGGLISLPIYLLAELPPIEQLLQIN